MGEDGRAIFGDVFVKEDASAGVAQQTRQRGLAVEECLQNSRNLTIHVAGWGSSSYMVRNTALKRLVRQYGKPALRRIWPWRHKNLNGIRVNYLHRLDGGGTAFGQDYIPYLRNRGMPRQARTFEWCAGPGFIGFSLLGCCLTETLCLADINPDAVRACRRSINDNKLAGRVDVYRSDNLADIPSFEKWDIVVGNPPHFPDERVGNLLLYDPGWRIHREFFSQVGAHLKPGGVIVLQEKQ
jgi:Methyltransferase small domain